MGTYLLTYNPENQRWAQLPSILKLCRAGKLAHTDWRVHSTKIRPGDRVFWMRQGPGPRGVFASGKATSSPSGPKRTARGTRTRYVQVSIERILDPESDPILGVERLERGTLAAGPWQHRQSGITIEPRVAAALDRAWAKLTAGIGSSAEPAYGAHASEGYSEGELRRVVANARERDPRARQACIEARGVDCEICGFNFERSYGTLGRGFIHVHHLTGLAKGGQRRTRAHRDLIPVCPNCHAMLHRKTSPLTPQALRARIRAASTRSPSQKQF